MAVQAVLATKTATNLPTPLSRGALAINSRALENKGESLQRDYLAVVAAGRLSVDFASLKAGRSNASAAATILDLADQAFAEIATKLARLKVIATEAANQKVNTTDPDRIALTEGERGILNLEFMLLRDEISDIASRTEFNGTKLLLGDGGSPVLSIAINVGGGTSAIDTVTLTLDAGTVANLAAGLATADIQSVADATTALTTVNSAIEKVVGARANVEAGQVQIKGAAAAAGARAFADDAERLDRTAPEITIELAQRLAEDTLEDRNIAEFLHDTQALRNALTVVVASAVPANTSAITTTTTQPSGADAAADTAQVVTRPKPPAPAFQPPAPDAGSTVDTEA